jgi:hypothetical protein
LRPRLSDFDLFSSLSFGRADLLFKRSSASCAVECSASDFDARSGPSKSSLSHQCTVRSSLWLFASLWRPKRGLRALFGAKSSL